MPGWVPWVFAGLVALFLLDRLLLRLEHKGWIFYRRTKGPRGGATYHVLSLIHI